MPKRYNNTIHKPFLRSKTIIITLSNITRTGLIIYIEDSEKAPSVDYIHIKGIKVGETTVIDIIITTYPVRSNATSIISLNVSQVSIQQKIDNKHTLNINNMPNIQENKKSY
jgi:hypothetical protein